MDARTRLSRTDALRPPSFGGPAVSLLVEKDENRKEGLPLMIEHRLTVAVEPGRPVLTLAVEAREVTDG
jgi:hypothetical protein